MADPWDPTGRLDGATAEDLSKTLAGEGSVGGPDGFSYSYDYRRGRGPRGDIREDRREREARNQALRSAWRGWADDEFMDLYGQDFLAGLRDYLPDYDTILDRTGTTFGDIMGADSQQARGLRPGARDFRNIYEQGGYTDLERGQIDQALQQARRGEQQQRGAVQQQMRMRGMGGSGLEAMGVMGAQQAGANQGLGATQDIAQAAQQRALQALSQGTQFAGQAGQAADAFNQAHLGWQDYQQQWQNQVQQQRYANEAGIRQAEMQQREGDLSRLQDIQKSGARGGSGDGGVNPEIPVAAINAGTQIIDSSTS